MQKTLNDSIPFSLAPQEHPVLKMRVNIEPAPAEPSQIRRLRWSTLKTFE